MTSLDSPERILIIRPSALGDVCRSVPVLVSLRRRYPSAWIDWLVQDSFASAVAAHPDLSGVLPFPRRRVAVKNLWRRDARRTLRELLRTLRAGKYELVYDFQGLGRSGFFAWMTRAPERIGFADARELGFLGVNRRFKIRTQMHTVDRMLALLEASGVPAHRDLRLYTSAEDRDSLSERLRGLRFAVVAPTSRWTGKRWPAERFVELTRALLSRGGVERVAVVGSGAEREQIAPMIELAQRDHCVVDLIGATGVGSLMATIEASALVVANDSAALHMAVGFDRPLVGLFGPTRLELVGPYRRDADVISAPPAPGVIASEKNRHKHEDAGRAAMEAIPTARVIEAAIERLDARAVTRPNADSGDAQ